MHHMQNTQINIFANYIREHIVVFFLNLAG